MVNEGIIPRLSIEANEGFAQHLDRQGVPSWTADGVDLGTGLIYTAGTGGTGGTSTGAAGPAGLA